MFFMSAFLTPVQGQEGARVGARANVTPYEDEAGIEKNAYRESPYFYEISGTWKQRQTDSSVVYTKQIAVEKYWKDYRVFLNVRCGRGCRVLLNGKFVGSGDDSRHWNEFALDKFLKYGKQNTLTVEAMKRPLGALLESEDTPVGLNGEPYLVFKNDPNVADFTLLADYDAATSTGSLNLDVSVFNSSKKGKYYLEVEIWNPQGRSFDRMGRWVVFDKKSEASVDFSRSWGGVETWTAETPSLYSAVLRLRNEKMEEVEVVGTRFGFRRVEVKDGVLQVNGKAVTLKGVVFSTENTGSHADRSQIRAALQSMKLNNVNAVRTAKHSPVVPYFYELCDEMGLYVVCDANLNPVSSQHQAVATDRDFIPLFERRIENLFGKYKNHTSIVAWSLGDTRDNGVCMNAAYKRLKNLDKNRPVLFSGAEFTDATDVIALDNSSETEVRQVVAKSGERPFLILSAPVDNYDQLWRLVENQRQLQGGFVASWPLTPVMLAEIKALYSPFSLSLSKITPDEAEFTVYNRNDFSGFGQYILEYTIYTNLRPSITAGDLPVAISGGDAEKVSLRLPPIDMQPGEEMFIRFDLVRRNAPKGQRELGTVAFPLPYEGKAKKVFVNDYGKAVVDSTLMPHLQFAGHKDWLLEEVAVIYSSPDSNTACVDAMLQYKLAGVPMCDVRTTYTFFGSGDVVVDYTVSPTDAFRGTLGPQLLVSLQQRDHDTLSWFGLDRELFFSQPGNGIPGIYSVPRAKLNGATRQQVRWCADRQDGVGLYAALLDAHFTLNVSGDQLMLSPNVGSKTFRLHLRRFKDSESLSPEDFYGIEMPSVKTDIVDPPAIQASEVRFSQPLAVSIIPKSEGEVRYTLDGSEPTAASTLYTAPFTITTTTVVKARVFRKDGTPSFTATRKFNYDYIVATTFSRKPSPPYNVGTDTILFDGEKGSVDNFNEGWLGFSGNAVTATVELSKSVDVEYVTLRFAHSPATWAFAPRQLTLMLSPDGSAYADTLSVRAPFDPADEAEKSPRVVEFRVPVGKAGVKYLKVIANPIAAIPAWHRAKGLKPWMLIDEIEVGEKIEN